MDWIVRGSIAGRIINIFPLQNVHTDSRAHPYYQRLKWSGLEADHSPARSAWCHTHAFTQRLAVEHLVASFCETVEQPANWQLRLYPITSPWFCCHLLVSVRTASEQFLVACCKGSKAYQLLFLKLFQVWISDEPFKVQWLLYVPPGLTFTNLRSAHTLYLCVLCGSQNKQRLFHCTALTDWFV